MRRFSIVITVLVCLGLRQHALAEEIPAPPAADAPAGASHAAANVSGEEAAPAEAHAAEQDTADTSAENEETPPADGEPIIRPEPDMREKELIATIKMLFAAQDAVAAGHDEAKALQASLLGLIVSKDYGAQRMTGSAHLAGYLAGYVLSGGDPRLVEALIASSQFDEAAANLLNGCILYRRAKRDEALKALEGVDLAALSAPVLGRVALARAVITADPKARERLLAIAIAAMPGTLVEEGALRRSALGFGEAGDYKNFWKRVDRYARRFPHSGYLPDFLQQVASAAAHLSESNKRVDMAEMDRSLCRLGQSDRQRVFISLARLGASRHMVGLVAYASSRLGRIAVPGSREEQVARLYDSAYRLLDGDQGARRQVLESIDVAVLPDEERKLLQAALVVSGEIDAPFVADGEAVAPAATPLVTRAEAALRNADKLLQEPM